jgi:cation transport regulator ChaC
MTGSAVYNLTFTREMMETPILGTIARRFRISLTIRRAMLSEEGGVAEVAFSGLSEEIERAIADLQTFGVTTHGPLETLVGATTGTIQNPGRGT